MEATKIKNRLNAIILLGILVLGGAASVTIGAVGGEGSKQNAMATATPSITPNASEAISVAAVGSKAQKEPPLLDTFDRATALLEHNSGKRTEDAAGGSPAPATAALATTPLVVMLHVVDKPQGIAIGLVRGKEMVWIASLATRSVVRLDPYSGCVIAMVPLDIAPLGLALGEDALWVTGGLNTLERLDPETNRVVARMTVGMNPRVPVVNEDAVWIPNANDHTVSRIDPRINRVVATIPIGDALDCPRSEEPLTLAAGSGEVWVTECKDKAVARIDTTTNQMRATIRLGVEPTGLQLVGNSLWVTSRSYDRVMRIDTQTGRIIASITVTDPGAITATTGAVWVETSAGRLARINAYTDQVMDTLVTGVGQAVVPPSPVPSLPGVMMSSRLGSLAASEGSVWASGVASNVVVRIDLGPTK